MTPVDVTRQELGLIVQFLGEMRGRFRGECSMDQNFNRCPVRENLPQPGESVAPCKPLRTGSRMGGPFVTAQMRSIK